MTDFAKGERLYQEFLEFRDQFLTKAMKEASATSKNRHGEKFRPVVIVPERAAAKLESQIKQWESYADELSKYPELGIPVSLYQPAPVFITGANRVRCNELEAVNSQNVSRDAAIREAKKLIARVSGSGDIADTNSLVNSLNEQLAFLEGLPKDAKLRVRRGGYTDLVCTYNTATEKKLMVRVTASGVFFDDRVLRYGFKMGKKSDSARKTVYDVVKPLPLTIYGNAPVYLVDEVNRVKAEMKAEREANHETIMRERWSAANAKRRAAQQKEKATRKGAAKSAGEQNPAGSSEE